ncbi:hypothetical protein BFAG_03106 [Bacteroides fragilis 3_1_12]|uniref:Uncharacterized protein n=2 Tax=Bacteroides fragilis TaxID=817 RepID=A0ABN0BN88_BACFG|nr:hypothetical protein BFAG_03106 [Bacteroides fragilis 3_1_12]
MLKMKKLFIYKGLELDANINGYATYELKAIPFKPKYAGQLNFYINVVDDQMRGENVSSAGAHKRLRRRPLSA